jgi:ABC-type sulfate transport system permease component
VTQTLPLAVYAQLDQDLDVALAIGALLVAVSAGILVGVKLLPAWERFVSTSPSPFATSSSR